MLIESITHGCGLAVIDTKHYENQQKRRRGAKILIGGTGCGFRIKPAGIPTLACNVALLGPPMRWRDLCWVLIWLGGIFLSD